MKKQRIIPKHSHQAGGIVDGIFNTIGSNSDLIGKLFNWKDYTSGDIEKLKKAYEDQYNLIGQQTFTGGFDELESNYGSLNVASAPSKWDMGYMTKQQEQNAVLGATLSGFGRGYNAGKSASKSINNFGKGLNEKYPGAADYLSENGFSDNSWGSSVEGMAGDFLNNYGSYATAAKIGTTWLGGVLGNIWGQNYVKDRNKAAEKAAAELENEREGALMRRHNNFRAAVSNADTQMDNFYQSQYAAFGGMLGTNGTDWETGATYIDNGSTHQNNPFGGVQYGVASDGLPNLVEEGEVVIKVKNNQEDTGKHSYAKGGPIYSDYVLSNRVIPTVEELTFANITDNPSKYEGQPYAQIYKDLTKGLKETINSPITKNYLDILHTRIARAQEDTKLREQQEEFMTELKKATPKQQDIILQQMGYANPLEEATMAAKGGEIYIKPSKRGTFTAAAKKRGMGVQEFASKVLANKEDYSPAMVKKANFARNAGHWHQQGGFFNTAGTSGLAVNNDWIVPSSSYKKAAAFNNILDENGNYLPGYVDWINNLTQEDYDYLSTLPNFNKKLNPDLATFKRRVTDKNFQNTHAWINSLYRPNTVEPYEYNGDMVQVTGVKGSGEAPTILMEAPTEDTPVVLNLGRNDEEYVFNNQNQDLIENPFKNNYLLAEVDRNAYPTPTVINAAQEVVDKVEDDDEIESVYDGNTEGADGFLPLISGLQVAADWAGITNRPEYDNATRVGNAIIPPRFVQYRPNGRYVRPQLVDTNYLAARLANQSMAGINAVKDLSGANRATALANIAAQNYLGQQATGEAIAQSQIANNKAIQDAVQINNAVDRANSEGFLQAARANQAAWDNYIGRYTAQKTAEAKLREDIDNQVAANRSANWNNFLENMQGYFDNQRNRTMANDSLGRMYGYNIASNGSITFNNNNNKKKFAEDYNINIKDVDKVRRRKRNGVTKFYLNGKELTRKGE